MANDFILSDYIDEALNEAVYDKLEDGSFAGRVPACTGVLAFAPTLAASERELRSTLEDWVLVGLKLGHSLPVLAGIDLNREPSRVFPRGWDKERVQRLIAHYEDQSEEEAVAEDEAAFEHEGTSMIEVPDRLVRAVREPLTKR